MESKVKARFAGSLLFLVCGSAMAIFAVHIPAIEHKLGLTHAILGSLLLLVGGGAFTSMELTGRFIDRKNSKLASIIGSILIGLALWAPGFATSVLELAVTTFFLGFAIGVLDVAMNAHAMSVERAYGRPIFSSFHAYFSIGGLVGASVGALTLSLQLGVEVTLPLLGSILSAVSLLACRWLMIEKKVDASVEASGEAGHGVTLGYVLFLGLISGFAALAEGTAGDWSALELITIHGTSQAVGAFGLVCFSVSMFVMRLTGDRLVARFGRIFVIRWGSLVAALGLSLVTLAASVPVTLLGWLILGSGTATIVPQMFALADESSEPAVRGRNMSRVLALTYVGILAGPASIGWLTLFMPLNLAIGVCGILMVLTFLASYKLKVKS